MGWADILNTAISGISAGFGIYSGLQAMETANEQADILAGDAATQNKISNAMFNRTKNTYWPIENKAIALQNEYYKRLTPQLKNKLWADYKAGVNQLGEYRDIENEMIDEANRPVQSYINQNRKQVMSDIAQSFDKNAAIQTRDMARMGIDPGSGRGLAQSNSTAIARALSEVSGLNVADSQAREESWNKKAAMLGYKTGYEIPTGSSGDSSSSMSQALSALSGSQSGTTSLLNSATQSMNSGLSSGSYMLNRFINSLSGLTGSTTSNTSSGING